MRLANGIVIDKEATFGALKFSALRREVHLQNEDGSVSSRKIKFPSPAQKQRIIIVSSQIHLFHCAGKNGALFFLCTS